MPTNLVLTSDFPSTANEAVAARLRAAAPIPRVAWLAPQASLMTRAHYLAAQLAFRSLGIEREYSESVPHAILALDDGTAILHIDGRPSLTGRAVRFVRGLKEPFEGWRGSTASEHTLS